MDHFETARTLLREFKGDAYLFGNHVLDKVGTVVVSRGSRAALVHSGFRGIETHLDILHRSLKLSGVTIVADIPGARPNAPREDLVRITESLRQANPEVIISFGGGSSIDATKAAEVLRTLGGDIDEYFGVGLVTKKLQACSVPVRAYLSSRSENAGAQKITPHGVTTNRLTPHVAIQTAAGSGAHLTKYSNITDLATGQKKLIVDDAIVPSDPVFDYTITHLASPALTADGALDGFSHILEVFYGAVGKPHYDKLRQIAEVGIVLIVNHLPKVIRDPQDARAREALCLATDLGAYAIMVGGTNGGHLTSFSLVDVLTHGRACALMNPYYTVFFAPAVQAPLRVIGKVFQDAGYLSQDPASLHGRQLGIAVANGMFAFARAIGFPTTLGEVPGFSQDHIDRALTAAKNPQLRMKLENMPIPMTADMIDEYMGPILQAAAAGDVSIIRNV